MEAEHNGAELDLGAFKARLRAGRQFHLAAGSIRLWCVLPSPIDERVTAQRFQSRPVKDATADERTSLDRADLERWMHELSVASVEGWDGVYVRDVEPGDKHGDMPLPCMPDTVRTLLEFRLDLNDLVGGEILRRRRERDDALEAAAKNSDCASTGNDTETKRSDSPGSATLSPGQS